MRDRHLLTWTSRALENGEDAFAAGEIEVERHEGELPGPEIEGAVGSVRVADHVIVAVPNGDDPLLFQGRSITGLDVHVLPTTVLVRVDRTTGGITAIQAGDVVASLDEISIRGTATGATSIDATSIRVRDDRR
ncbi:MAG TPA: hypothetical protein VK348_00050 [Planctomycetota bacterium]|nr:hypothetical protein [Planctomycetota bacterium]